MTMWRILTKELTPEREKKLKKKSTSGRLKVPRLNGHKLIGRFLRANVQHPLSEPIPTGKVIFV